MKKKLKITKTFYSSSIGMDKSICIHQNKIFENFQISNDLFSPETKNYIVHFNNKPILIPESYTEIIQEND
jgi:hypothetical protein